MTSHVYFAASNGSIKIGYSTNIPARLTAIRTGNPSEVLLLGTLPGGRELEREIHAALSNYRLQGEWFKDCADVRNCLATYRSVANNRECERQKASPERLASLLVLASGADAENNLADITQRFGALINTPVLRGNRPGVKEVLSLVSANHNLFGQIVEQIEDGFEGPEAYRAHFAVSAQLINDCERSVAALSSAGPST